MPALLPQTQGPVKIFDIFVDLIAMGIREGLAAAVGLFIFCSQASAEFDLTIIQTSDIHSHFTNRESPLSRGGLARVLWKINDIRQHNTHTLLLDAGDWSEGNMFFTLDTGETSQRLISAMNYDAIVLGNHDWLVGPQALFNTFEQVGFKIPVLSGNINTHNLDPAIDLKKYIKPYIVKEIDGVRVGIFGVSTFQLIYDSYFKPVKLVEPFRVAAKYVNVLRHKEKCQIVIMLSHLGIGTDKAVGKLIPGIDYIVGGHTHILLKTPAYGGHTPITHVGAWGQYVGETHLGFDGKMAHLKSYTAHPIEATLPEDPMMKALVDGAIAGMERKYGPVYSDNILLSDVDLPAQRSNGESVLGNWAIDAIRQTGQAEMGLDTPFFASRDFYMGQLSTADFFNAFPHIYNPTTGQAWTVKTFELSGMALKFLMNFSKLIGLTFNVSHSQVVINDELKQIHSIQINGEKVHDFQKYKIAATDGIWGAVGFFKQFGIDLHPTNFQETGVEVWRLIMKAVSARSPITRNQISWEGRIRSLQPDLDMRPEEIEIVNGPQHKTHVDILVRNAGTKSAAPSTLIVSTTENDLAPAITTSAAVPALSPGATEEITLNLDTSGRPPGKTPLHFHLNAVPGEFQKSNNDLDEVLDVPSQ